MQHFKQPLICLSGSLLLTAGAALTPGLLFFLTACLGLAHFIFAYQGQLSRIKSICYGEEKVHFAIYIYFAVLLSAASLLTNIKDVVGSQLFNGLVWLYFIGHFLKAEKFFFKANKINGSGSMFIGMLALLMIILIPLPILMTVALASFYHYLRSYQFALERKEIGTAEILTINLLVLLIALTAGYLRLLDPSISLPELEPWLLAPTLRAFLWALDPANFTIWVALHLVSSDYFAPLCRFLRKKRPLPSLSSSI